MPRMKQKYIKKTLYHVRIKFSIQIGAQTNRYVVALSYIEWPGFEIFALQLETAIIFDILCNPLGSSPAKTDLAGCADIVTVTFLTQGSAPTTSFALCSNWNTKHQIR